MSDSPAHTELLRWTPYQGGGALCGWADVRLSSGLKLYGVGIWFSNGKCWASLPVRAKLDRAGHQIITDGVKQYEAVAAWPDRATADKFSQIVCDLVARRDHEAFRGATNEMLRRR